jgi:hypothetical protein
VTDPEAPDAAEAPTALVAVTVNVYVVPVVRPVTVNVPLPDWFKVAVTEPGVDVAVYDVIVAPPVDVGAVKATVAEVTLAIAAAPIVGATAATAATVNDTVTCGAASVVELPA